MSKVTKSTTLEGYYATGDCECFCFDTHEGPEAHRAAQEKMDPAVRYDPDRSCRTYPSDLLPEGTDGKVGRWTITVEFEPYGTTGGN